VTDVLMLQRLSADLVVPGLGDENIDSLTQLDCGCSPPQAVGSDLATSVPCGCALPQVSGEDVKVDR
jgi:hypothetical protein